MTAADWGKCACDHRPDWHNAVIVRPICIDPGNRVLFEGTLGGCQLCECDLYVSARQLSQQEATR